MKLVLNFLILLMMFFRLQADIPMGNEGRFSNRNTTAVVFDVSKELNEETFYYYEEWKGDKRRIVLQPGKRYYEKSYELYITRNGTEVKLSPIINIDAKENQRVFVSLKSIEGNTLIFSNVIKGDSDTGYTLPDWLLPSIISLLSLIVFILWIVKERRNRLQLA